MAAALRLALVILAAAGRPLAATIPTDVADGLASAGVRGEVQARLTQAELIVGAQLQGDARAARGVLEDAAQHGDGRAAYTLGVLAYQTTPADIANTQRWWRRAAQAGYADAQYGLGLLLAADQQHSTEADAAFAAAAAQQHVLACFALGTRLAARDAHAARAWLQCAAAQGYGPAQFNLATLLVRAARNDDDLATAQRWYAAAAPTFTPAASALAALRTSREHHPTSGSLRDADWVMAQAASAFTLQVASGASAEVLMALLQDQLHDLDTACLRERPASRQPYSAIVGVYADRLSAERALGELPSALRANQPWIRRFGDLQQALRRAASGAAPAAKDTQAVSN